MSKIKDEFAPKPKTPRICLVTPCLPPTFGGGGDLFYRYAVRLHQRGELAFVFTYLHAKQSYQKFHSQLPEGKVKRFLLELNEKTRSRSWSRVTSRLGRCSWLFIQVGWLVLRRRSQFDVVHVMGNSWLCMMAVLWARVLGKKTVYEASLAGSDDALSVKQTGGVLRYWLLTRSHAFLARSPLIYKLCREGGIPQDKLHLFGNSVDTDLYCPVEETTKADLRTKLSLPLDKKIITFVGGIIERKGTDLIPAIFRDLLRTVPSACMVLVGPEDNKYAPTGPFIRRELHEQLANGQVIFTGVVSNLAEYLQSSDVFLFPSRMEGFGTALAEAMACGLPCIAHNIEGITQFIIEDNVDGFIVPDENTFTYASIIGRLLSDNDKFHAISRNARQKVVGKFSAKVVDRQCYEIYTKLLEPADKAP